MRSNPAPPFAGYQALQPCRRLGWRWRHACDLVAAGRRLSSRNDNPETLVLAPYLRSLSRCEGDADRAKARRRRAERAELIRLMVLLHEAYQATAATAVESGMSEDLRQAIVKEVCSCVPRV